MMNFAYGSNMDWDQIRHRCPSVVFVCRAELKNHSLAFPRKSKKGHGVASVEPKQGISVWGVVYQIAKAEESGLDKCEGFRRGRAGNSYERVSCLVDRDGDSQDPLSVQVYIANPMPDPPPPNEEYMGHILEGAKCWGLPPAYIAWLGRIKTNG